LFKGLCLVCPRLNPIILKANKANGTESTLTIARNNICGSGITEPKTRGPDISARYKAGIDLYPK
jgi:hypothetical protein